MEEFRRQQRSGILVLLFTDMVGSTKLKQDLGDQQAVAIVRQHHATIRQVLKGFPDGKEIDTAGDSFFIVFVKPSDGVKFALLLQAAMRQFVETVGHQISLRIGIHAGEVFMEDHEQSRKPMDLYGIQVDSSSRVMSLAQGNQILLTRFVFDNARQLLKGEEIENVGALSWLNHGPYLMKGVEEAMEICEVGEAGLSHLARPADSEKAHRHITAESEPVLGWRPAAGQPVPNTGWVLVRQLGSGGFGEVWLGRHEKLGDQRVFKFCFHAGRVRSLKREVTMFRLLKQRGHHPNIVGIQDVFFDEPPFYIMMEYADGEDLVKWVAKQGGVDKVLVAARMEIVAQVADALQAAHDAGIIHRDIKPSNIIVSGSFPGVLRVKLTDFGIGQVISQDVLARVTQMGFTQTISGSSDTGTPMYMAPELLAGKPASVQSDIYSLGVVYYQLLAGDLARPSTMDWARDVENPLMREDLAKCLAGNPQERFANARELSQRLRTMAERRSEFSRIEAKIAAEMKGVQRKKLILITTAASIIVLLMAALAVWAIFQSSVARNQARISQMDQQEAKTAERAAQEMEREAKTTLSASEFLQGAGLLAEKHESAALACLARSLFDNPTNDAASTRLATLLGERYWAVPASTMKHAGAVFTAQFSPDGLRVATASKDHTARIWDATCGEPLTEPLLHGGEVNSVQFSTDGKRVVTASADGTARVWDASSGKPLTEPLRHGSNVCSARFSPDGTRIVTASWDHSARVWDASSGQPATPALAHDDQVFSARFSPDGLRVVTASADHTARIWDAQSGEALVAPLKHDGPVAAAQFSPDGARIVTVSGDSARIWDARTGQPLAEPLKHADAVISAQFSPGGTFVLTASADGTARVWDALTGQPQGEPLKHDDVVESAQFSPDGLLIVTASEDRTMRVWSALTGAPWSESIRHDDLIYSAQFSSDGKRIVTASRDGTVRLFETVHGKPHVLSLPHDNAVTSAQFSPDGKWIATASVDQTAQVWDARSGQPLSKPLAHQGSVVSARFSPDGKRVLTASWDHTARVWDAQTGEALTGPLKHGDNVVSAQFSPDGTRVVTASKDHTARVWNSQSGEALAGPLKHDGDVTSAQFSPDGKLVLTSSMDGTARIWDAQSGKPAGAPLRHGDAVGSAQFSPDGARIVTASEDHTARVWNGLNGQPMTAPLQHNDIVVLAQFSPDGTRIVTASGGSARVWDAETGQPLTGLMTHEDIVVSAQFSPDGRYILTASWDHAARLWDARTAQPLSDPWKQHEALASAQFSPDGRRFVTASGDQIARVWDVAPPSDRHPDWLPRLAEAIAGQTLNKQGLLELSQTNCSDAIDNIRQQVSKASESDEWAAWGRWFLAGPKE
jgi:WD40 repeat protein/serine/threonine protein kinase/class 3 adenylate cyclase